MSSATILLVESEKSIAGKLQNKLRKLGYDVPDVAVSCQDAIHKAERLQPDLVLMGIQPEGSGNNMMDLAEKLRSCLTVPVAYLATDSDKENLQSIPLTQSNVQPINSLEDSELKATIEMTLYDHHSQSKLTEIKQWLTNKLGKLSEALSAIDQITETSTLEEVATGNTCSPAMIETEVVKTASSRMIPAGSEVFVQGEHARGVYLIERGLIKLIRREGDGKEAIAAIRYPGWLLAATSVILDEPLPLTAVTVTRCRLTRIEAPEFLRLIRNSTEYSWKLHRMLAREVNNLVIQLTGVECLSARQRLEELLWQLISVMVSASSESPVRVLFPAKYSEIAQILGVTPQYLSSLIGQLEKDGIARRDKGWVIVFHPEKLWHREDLDEPSCSFSSFS